VKGPGGPGHGKVTLAVAAASYNAPQLPFGAEIDVRAQLSSNLVHGLGEAVRI
jgi:hypothetical protein